MKGQRRRSSGREVVSERIGWGGQAADEEESPQLQCRSEDGGLTHFRSVLCGVVCFERGRIAEGGFWGLEAGAEDKMVWCGGLQGK